MSKEPKPEKLKYRCKKCGLITEHIQLRRPQVWCPKCKKSRMQTLIFDAVGRPLAAPSPPAAVTGKVTVTHVPETVTPEAPKASVEPGAPGEEEWAKAQAGEPLAMDAEDWANLYGMAPEAISLYFKAPELNFSNETCKIQGERISKYCIRHNIVLPPFLDIVPIAITGLGDYMKLIGDTIALRKEREKEEKTETKAPKEVKIPESTVAHVAPSSELPADFDIGKALKATEHRKKPTAPTGGP